MTLKDLFVGKKVRATIDCRSAVKGVIYTIQDWDDRSAGIGQDKESLCSCASTWELLEPIKNFKPKPHKHRVTCADCGEEVKK